MKNYKSKKKSQMVYPGFLSYSNIYLLISMWRLFLSQTAITPMSDLASMHVCSFTSLTGYLLFSIWHTNFIISFRLLKCIFVWSTIITCFHPLMKFFPQTVYFIHQTGYFSLTLKKSLFIWNSPYPSRRKMTVRMRTNIIQYTYPRFSTSRKK